MLKGREILSLPVITSNDRKQIGEVKDIIYDPFGGVVLGYLIDMGGWIRDGKGFLHKELIRRDEEGLIITDDSTIRNVGSIPELKNAIKEKYDIRGFRVEYPDGQYIGIIRDLVIDNETSEITGYEISDGVIQDLLDGRSTVPRSALTVVSDRVIAELGGELDTSSKGEIL